MPLAPKTSPRAEHWVVVKGTARITKGDKVITITENESTYIPLGVRHRLENPGKIPLELIEVQSGSYLVKTISNDSTTDTEEKAAANKQFPLKKHFMNQITCFKAYDIRGRSLMN